MTWEELTKIGEIVRTLIVPIIGYVAYVVRDIRSELRDLNGRMLKLETWRHEHDNRDDERHGETREAIADLRMAINRRGMR